MVVLVLALFSAALGNPTDSWRRVTITLTVVVVFIATLLAVVNRSGRTFPLGFAMAGWLYFLLTFNSTFRDLRPLLLTDPIVERCAAVLHVDLREPVSPPDPFDASLKDHPWYKMCYFGDIGHCLWTLILATIGGLAAIWLQRPTSNKSRTRDQPH